MPEKILTYLQSKPQTTVKFIEESINHSILETNNELKSSQIETYLSGSTLILTLIWNDIVFFATVGDSRAFLASKKGNNVVSKLQSNDHKPENPKERKRIEAAGGIVGALKDEYFQDYGPQRVWNKDRTMPGLAMSRSMGDDYAHSLGVSANPEIWMSKLSDKQDRYIVLGSDGIFEF